MSHRISIGQSNEVVYRNEIFDLHNLFDFAALSFQTDNLELHLCFEPDRDYHPQGFPIRLVFSGVNYLEFSSCFFTRKISGVDEMGYKSTGDFDYGWLKTEDQLSQGDHLVIRFDTSAFIRIGCNSSHVMKAAEVKLVS